MTTEERVMTLFAEANPVPVLDDIAPEARPDHTISRLLGVPQDQLRSFDLF